MSRASCAGDPPAARVYVAGVIVVGAALLAFAWPPYPVDPVTPGVLLAASCMLSFFKLRLPLACGEASMSLAYVVDFAALLLCGPDVAMLVGSGGVLVQCRFRTRTRQPIVRTAFSMASVVVSVQAAGLAWSLLGGNLDAMNLATTIGPMSAAATVYFFANSGLVAAAVALTCRRSPSDSWRTEFLWSAPSTFLSAAIGTMVAIIVTKGVYALLLLALAPLYISYLAYRVSVDRIEAERLHARELAGMVATTQQALARATDSETALVAEKEHLALESARLLATLGAITDGVVTIDRSGVVLLMNQGAADLSGLSRTTAGDRPIRQVFSALGVDRADYEHAIDRVLVDGTPTRFRSETAAASPRVVDVTGTPMRCSERGAVAGAVWVLCDVTDATRAEHERSRLARLESLGVLAGGLAHDFNNILMGVVGNLSLAQALVRPTDRRLADRLREAEAACVRARGVTSQLLTFAKGGAPVKTAVSMRELVSECARFALSGSPVASRFVVDPNLWTASVDTVQVGQVVHNLVLNAMQAMPRGGTVEVTLTNVFVTGGAVDVPSELAPGRYVRLSVADTGPGIPPDHVARIFEPYFTTKEKGSGLGLAISFSIARAHGGTIRVASTPGGSGSRFDVFLPAAFGKVPAMPERAVEATGDHSGRVLLMDDEPMVAEVARDMLANLGYVAETADSGEAAIAKFRSAEQRGEPFDAVILDLTVPGGMGGRETVPGIRSLRGNVPVLVTSGYADNSVLAEFRLHGFDGVLPKPFSIPDLRVALDEARARQSARPRVIPLRNLAV